MSTDILIDLAQNQDFEEIAEIYNHYILAANATMERSQKTSTDIAVWVQQFNERERLLVAKEKNQILGWGILKKYSDREGYKHAAEVSIYLKPSSTRRGLGSKIHDELLTQAKELDYYHLTAKIFAKNERSIRFFESFGYEKVGIQHKIGKINNQFLDMIILEKLL